ncbi:hypothetical protein PGT21_022460 [Puccinia graminis f. sp. tritici]|uniref:Uncharacterized protein n=1 Tax=Puccinia graminis f. sp. tritici TaxID=56615 RepID=A0A5B0QVF9_PUCGR|nr:hypothetical protein PGT21_022460 [Puccinia graminis f. sp. tritici]KAA1117169.1 hypothetical protein PGTUg99_036654 [Puccinia graminis f. sp. tritici]
MSFHNQIPLGFGSTKTNCFLILSLLIIVHIHVVLAVESRIFIDLDPPDEIAEEAANGESPSSVVECHPRDLSPLPLFPTSASPHLEESVISHPAHSPETTPPEASSSLSLSLSDGFGLGRKRPQTEKKGSQREEEFQQPAPKRLSLGLDLSLGHSRKIDPQPHDEGLSVHTSEEQQHEMNAPKDLHDENSVLKNQGHWLLNKNKHEKGAASLTGSTLMGTEKVVRKFEPGGVSEAFWAWVWVIWEHVGKSATWEVESYLEPSMENLKSWCFRPNSLYPYPNIKKLGETSDSDWQHDQINLFASLLWAVNSRVLEIIGVGHPNLVQPGGHFEKFSPYYFGEQSAMIKWFVGFMKLFNNPDASAPVNHKDTYDFLIAKKGKMIYEKILKALHSISDKRCHQTFRPKYSKDYVFTLEKELLMSEAVVYLLGFYYKNTNFQKWKYAFKGQDMDFVTKLENLGEFWKDREMWFFPLEHNLVPWKNPCTQDLPWIGLSHFHIHQFNFMHHIQPIHLTKPIANLWKIGDSEKFRISNWFSLDSVPDLQARLKIISNLNPLGQIELMPEMQPDSRLIRITEDYLSSLQSDPSNKNSVIPYVMDFSNIQTQLLPLFKLVWQIDGKILQSMGCEIYQEDFLKEQKLVQRYFEFLMNPNNEKDLSLETLGEHQNSDLDAFKKAFQNEVMELLYSDHHDLVHKTTNPEASQLPKANIPKEIRMCRIAILLIGNYYKNVNFQKWQGVIGADISLLGWIRRFSDPNKWLYYSRALFPQMKSHNLIPWKDEMKNPSLSFIKSKETFSFHDGNDSDGELFD